MDTTVRHTCWSLTINNPTSQDDESISLARQKGWKVEGQKEKGAEGTVHYQLMLRTPQVRFSAVKKAFPRAHIEVARNIAALAKYVTKESTREEQLNISQDQYPSLSKFWELIYERLTADNCFNFELSKLEFVKGFNFHENPFHAFDQCVRELIEMGYMVEGIATNPQTRTSWKLYAIAIMRRVHTARSTDSQTDRQRVESASDNLSVESITNADGDERKEIQLCEDGESVETDKEVSCEVSCSKDSSGSGDHCEADCSEERRNEVCSGVGRRRLRRIPQGPVRLDSC